MGNNCERFFMLQELKLPLDSDLFYSNKNKKDSLEDKQSSRSSRSVSSPVPYLQQLFNKDEVNKMYQTLVQELEVYKPQVTLFTTINQPKMQCKFLGMNLPKEQSSELLSVIIHEYQFRFSAEFYIYSSLNQELKITESFVEDELLQYEAYEDTLYMLTRLKTEKVLLVASRNILMLRVVRKLDENTYLDMNQTVNVTTLMKHKKIRLMVDLLQENFVTTFISGSIIENTNEGCKIISYVRSDFRTSVKLGFLKFFLNRNFEKVMKNTLDNLNQINESESWKIKKEYIWFVGIAKNLLKPEFFDRPNKTKRIGVSENRKDKKIK